MATCARCNASILWLRFSDTGRAIPVDASRVPNGNIETGPGGRAHVVKAHPMKAAFMPHYATCPEWKKERLDERRAAKRAQVKRQLNLFGPASATSGRR